MSNSSSAESSDFEAEIAEAAAAAADASELVAHALGPALESFHLEKVVHQADWDCKDNPDFREQKLAAQYRLVGVPKIRDRSKSPASDTSSMAVSVPSSAQFGSAIVSTYSSSSRTPSLGAYSSVKSFSSVKTSSVVQHHALDEDEDGALQAPSFRISQGRLACCFSFLKCADRFDNLKEWHTHCTSHLRGTLPREVHCPFECDWSIKKETGEEAWRLRTFHIVEEHADDDDVDIESKPPPSLIGHLWRNGIIDEVGKKELERHGRIINSDNTRSAGPTQDRRRDRRRPGERPRR